MIFSRWTMLVLVGSLGVSVLGAAPISKNKSLLRLTIDEYVRIALRQSDDAKTAYNNFQNSLNSYKISFRNKWLPEASVGSRVSKSNTETGTSETTTESASGELNVSQPFYPTGASLSGNYSEDVGKSDASGSITRTRTDPSYRLSLTQPLFLFKGNSSWRTWKQDKINYLIAEDNYRQSLQQVENTARQRYFNVLKNRETLEVENYKLQSSEKSYTITAAMVKVGRKAGIEKSRADLNLKRDRRRLQNAETTLKQSLNDFLDFASIEIGTPVEFETKLTYQPLIIPLETLINFAYHHNPGYLAAERQLGLSEISLKEAKEADNPDLSAIGSISTTESESNGSRTETDAWSGSVNMTWPFFDSRKTKLRVESAKNNLENQRIQFESEKRSIETQVTNAYLDVKKLEEQLNDLKISQKQARQAVEVTRTRYKNGLDRLVDVFDSENQLRDVELEYLDAQINANLAKDRLELLIGGRLEDVK